MEHVSFFVITILVFVIAIFVTAITVVLYKVIFIMIFLLRIKSIQEETEFSFLFHSIVRTWIPLSLMNQTGNLLFSSLNLMKKKRSNGERWHLLGTRVPQTEIVYFCQIIIVYVIIITSIINLSLQNGSSELWISLLSSCIGYVLPSPKLKK